MKFKTKPFKHQLKALRLSQDKQYFALLMEQGTGKSKVIIDTIAHLRRAVEIDTVLIIAPKGVAPGWMRVQIPEHMPDDIDYDVGLWKAKSRMTMAGRKELKRVAEGEDVLKIYIMNTEAFGAGTDAVDFAIGLLDAAMSALVVVDESHRIKTPQAHTTKRIVNLRIRSTYRRILTGTVADKPFDVFSQFNFLSPDILGTDSFTAFKGEYAELLPAGAGLMQHIARRIPKVWKGQYINDDTGQPADGAFNADGSPRQKLMVPKYLPTIVARNADGTPRYKNLDRLQVLIAPHSYRVLKADCLDLPPKLYNRYYTELADEQQALYNEVHDQHRIEWESGRISTFNKLTVYLRLQQVICGYVPNDTEGGRLEELFEKWEDNPRIVSMLECIDDRPPEERMVIWCRFVEDIRRVTEALQATYGATSVVQFYGAISDKHRIDAVERIEGVRTYMGKSGKVLRTEDVPDVERARFMVSQQRAGGIGQTWVAPSLSFHYSNTFSLIDRLQSEDRLHRIGQHRTVNYIDLEAEGTIDSHIITSLIAKKDVADTINADPSTAWLGP